MRHVLIAILASACTTTSTDDTAEDLGTFETGKADVQAIEVPLRLGGGEVIVFELTVNGPFELATKYAEDAELTLSATDGAASNFGVTAREPSLLVDAATGVTTFYKLTVSNTAPFTAVDGVLRVQQPGPTCDDAVWTAWLDTLAAKLAATGGSISASEQAVLDTIVAARPCDARTDVAYAAWLAHFDAQLVAANGSVDQTERAYVDLWVAVRPDTRTDGAYVAWAEKFQAQLVAAGTAVSATEDAFLRQSLRGKPCATGAAALAAWNQLALAAANDASELLADARPIAGCE